MLFFELFPLFIAIVSGVVAAGLYFANRESPDDSARKRERRRIADQRRARARNLPPERGGRRPSMSG